MIEFIVVLMVACCFTRLIVNQKIVSFLDMLVIQDFGWKDGPCSDDALSTSHSEVKEVVCIDEVCPTYEMASQI